LEVKGVALANLHRGNVGYGSDDCRQQLKVIAELGANWVAISEFAYMPQVDQPSVQYRADRSMDHIARTIRDAHALGLKVMLKPHLWSRTFYTQGKWCGDIRMNSQADWDRFFAEYGEFILRDARTAQQAGADALCVGVELQAVTTTQEARFRELITQVRAIYKGHLTYAAAYGEAPQVRFWDALDCIGIDAYYPIASSELATEDQLRAGWAGVYQQLEAMAKQWNKPICFTEIGYTDSATAGMEPWRWQTFRPSAEYQARLYRVAVEEATKRDYIRGLFVWKWFTSDRWRQSEPNESFCVQDRPLVLDVLRQAWRSESP
jgi:hypothetical protein